MQVQLTKQRKEKMNYRPENIEKKIKRKNNISKVFRTIVYIIIIPIIFYNISLIIQSFIKKDEMPSFFGIKSFIIISGSMEPELNIGDIIITSQKEQNEIEKKDIISFREGQQIITHRVEEIVEENGEKLYKTKGDNNNVSDRNLVKYNQIEGVYIAKIPKIGTLLATLKNKVVIISIILTLYIIYSHNLKKERKKYMRKQKRKQYENR